MKNLYRNSKKRRLIKIAQLLRKLEKRLPAETHGFLLLSKAIGHTKDAEIEAAIADLDRFEITCDNLSRADHALLQSVRAELRECGASKYIAIISQALVGIIFKSGVAWLWARITSKTQIYLIRIVSEKGHREYSWIGMHIRYT